MTEQPNPVQEVKRSTEQLQAEIEQTRTELVETIDALRDRLSPKATVAQASESAKQAAIDTRALLSGDGMPAQNSRARNVKVLLGAAAAIVVTLGIMAIRRR